MKYSKSAILMMLALSLQAVAQEQGHLNVTTTVQKQEVTVNDSGETETRLVAADSVVPGESVVYTITFQNISDEPAANVVITNPISEDLTYVDGSAFGPGTVIQFSTDGGQNFAAAEELTVIDDGVSRPAGPDDFTHIRWVMQNELAVGAQGTARFTAVLK
ncbi:MAG: DUF11 domain-containing protein [Proteobacteria bacterium]|nr:DUF11 domain-containing protein [Pseudomonadota bacterium]